MYQRILVATDGSTLSKKAVKAAIDLAALCGAELVAVKVVPRYPQSYFEGGIALQPEEVRRVESQWADEGQTVVDAVKKSALAKGSWCATQNALNYRPGSIKNPDAEGEQLWL